MNIDDILTHLPKLSASELTEIESRIAFLKATSRSTRVKLITIHDEFYGILEKYLYSEKGIKVPPYHVFENGKTYSTYDKGITVIEDFIKEHFPGITKIERIKLYHIFVEIVCDSVESFTGTTALPVICGTLQRGPDLFNRAFPGYVKAGLAKAILGLK
jgi:hypothetical protein